VTCSYPYEPYSWDLQSQRLGYHHLFVSSGLSLIPLDVSIIIFHPRILLEDSQNFILTSHNQWKLFHSLVATADWQSQCIFIPSGMLAKKFVNYSASLSPLFKNNILIFLAISFAWLISKESHYPKFEFITTNGFCLVWMIDSVSIIVPF